MESGDNSEGGREVMATATAVDEPSSVWTYVMAFGRKYLHVGTVR